MQVILALERQRQEDHQEFEASLCYIVRYTISTVGVCVWGGLLSRILTDEGGVMPPQHDSDQDTA